MRERENFARNSFQLTSFRGTGGNSERTSFARQTVVSVQWFHQFSDDTRSEKPRFTLGINNCPDVLANEAGLRLNDRA